MTKNETKERKRMLRGCLGSLNVIRLLRIREVLECVRTRGRNGNEIVKFENGKKLMLEWNEFCITNRA